MVRYLINKHPKTQKLKKMKKILICSLAIVASWGLYAQNNVENALTALSKNDFLAAKKEIDAAVSSEGVKAKAVTQLVRAYVYNSIAGDEKTKSLAPDGADVALDAFAKYFSLEKKFGDLPNVVANIKNNIIINYNNAINNYNTQKYDQAIQAFSNITKATKLHDGKLFSNDGFVDTIAAQAKSYTGYCYLYNKDNAKAKEIFESLENNKMVVDADMLLRLAQIYQADGQSDKWIGTLEKGRKLYPNEKAFVNEELNYYILTNKTAQLAVKLEDAVKADPTNAELNYSLGTTYDALLAKQETTPADAKKFKQAAIKAYETAINADPSKGDYVYNLAALYFNEAAKISQEIVKTKDVKKQKELEVVKKALFKDALPHFDKALKIFESAGEIKQYDRQNYFNVLTALSAIYSDNKDKAKEDEINKKMAKFK